MSNSMDIFVKTIQIGERLLGLSYRDYVDAYQFSESYFSGTSDHFLDFYENHSSLERGEYEYDLIRYFFIKAIEHRIMSDLYAETTRGNVCDVFRSPFDIDLPSYPTNLPKNLEKIVNSHMIEGNALAEAIISLMMKDEQYIFGREILNALQFIGQTVGYAVGQENLQFNGYDCSEMLTRNEINEIAGQNFCNWLIQNGFEIEEANFTRDTYQNIVALKEGERIFVLIGAEIAPENPGFIQLDLDNLYNAACEANASPYIASINLGSADDEHFQDGVIIYGDQIRFRVNNFMELEVEEG